MYCNESIIFFHLIVGKWSNEKGDYLLLTLSEIRFKKTVKWAKKWEHTPFCLADFKTSSFDKYEKWSFICLKKLKTC